MSAARSRFVLVVSMLGCLVAFGVAMLMGQPTRAEAPASRAVPGLASHGAAALGAELPSLRTARSRTYARPDGLRATRVWAQPVNYRDRDGRWQPIDTRLRQDGATGFVTAATPTTTRLPQDARHPTRVAFGGDWVSFALAGAHSTPPTLHGASARYAGVLDGVDAEYDAQASGVKETLILADASVPTEYTYTLAMREGLHATLLQDGAVAVRDHDGRTAFDLPAPTVQAANETAPRAAHVAYRLADHGHRLTVAVDPRWLASAAFPVKVDPSVWRGATLGCNLASGTPSTSDCATTQLKVGHVGGTSPSTLRTILRFADLGAIDQTASIADAQLFLPIVTASSVSARFDAYALTKTPSSGATWNTYDGTNAWTTAGGDVGSSPEDYLTLNAGQTGLAIWDVSKLAERWVRDASTNKGVLVRAQDESVANTITFGGPGASSAPALEIDWEAHPGAERDGTYESMGIDDRSQLTVNVATGNLAVRSQDIKLPGVAGDDLVVERTFNSTVMTNTSTGIDDSVAEPYGQGWTWTVNGAGLYSVYVFPDNTRTIIGAGGAVYRFDRDRSKDDASNAGYTTPPGIDADLKVSKTDGGSATLTFRKDGTKWTYAPQDSSNRARLTSIADSHGNTIAISYRSDRQVDHITDTHGRALTFNYDTGGKLQTISDAIGRSWTYSLTIAGTATVLGSFSNPDGKTTTYAYDAASSTATAKLNKITDARLHDITFQYGTGLDGGRVTNITRVVDGTTANDVTTGFDYHPASTTGHGCDANVINSKNKTEPIVARTVETDPRGKATTYCYSKQGEVIQTYDALGRKANRSYTPSANVQDFTDLAGTGADALTTYSFDASDNPTGATQPAGESWTTSYCGGSGPACNSSTNPGPLSQYRPLSTTDPQNHQQAFEYNAAGDVTKVADGSATKTAVLDYNADGTVKTSKDGNGNQTTYTYNTNHELTTVTPPTVSAPSTQLKPTTYTYDGVSRIKTITDGNGNTATVTYDGEDRVVDVHWSPTTFIIDWRYDENGNLTFRQDSPGRTTTYSYDNLNRRRAESFPSNRTNSYSWDKSSNLLTVWDSVATVRYSYDDINRVASVETPKPGTGADVVTYAYTDPTTSGQGVQQVATFPDATGNPVLKRIRKYNPSGRLIDAIVQTNGGTVLRKRHYDYTSGSSPQHALVDAVTDQAGAKTAYGYDSVNRLTQAATTPSGGSSATDTWNYTYDNAGNRTLRQHVVSGTTTNTSYAYNQNNQLCWSTPGATTNPCTGTSPSAPAGSTSYAYDFAGNRTSGSLAYDQLNRLTTMSSTALTYLTPGNGELIGYGGTVFQNGMQGLERQAPATGSEVFYAREPDGTPIAQRTSTAKQYLFGDRLGSTIAVADVGASSLTRVYDYDPDGNPSTSTSGLTGSNATTDLKFATGHQLPNGLYHFGARYYDPATATWTQLDPVNQIASLTEANRYAYAGSDPVNGIDLDGTCLLGFCDAGKAVLGAAGVVAGSAVIVGSVAAAAVCAGETDGLETYDCFKAGAIGVNIGAGGVGAGVGLLSESRN